MKKIHNLIIVDESGSMSSIEKQAVSGMLETLSSIKESQKLSIRCTKKAIQWILDGF